MSTKSDEPLDEEILKAFDDMEKTHSLKSCSEECLCELGEQDDEDNDDDEETLSSLLLQEFTPAVVARLRRCFRRGGGRERPAGIGSRIEEVMLQAAAAEGVSFPPQPAARTPQLWIDEERFVAAIDDIFGANKFTPHARELYATLCGPGSARLRWQQVARRLGHRDTPPSVTNPKIDFFKMEHAHRETLVKLVPLQTADWFCYAAVSRGGRVGVYSGTLELLHKYEVFYHRTGVSKRFKNRWITDAVFMPDVQFLSISSSDRALSVYEAATRAHAPLYCVSGVPDVPTCLAYSPYLPDGTSQLAMGTSRGDVILLTFLRPRFRLLYTGDQEQTNTYFWTELFLPPHTSYCCITRWRAHARSVTRVAFARQGLVLSCSHDCDVSLRARHTAAKLEDYVIKVQRGISCFHYSSSIQSLATGSRDGRVRVYCRGQSKPFATMSAAVKTAVLDVVLRTGKDMVVAFCEDCTLHLWNIYDESLLQTIKIKFPFLGVLGKKLDFGTYCIHPGPARAVPRVQSPTTRSHRSSVCHAPGGGLALEPDEKTPNDDEDLFLPTFTDPELLITCCDLVCRVNVDPPEARALSIDSSILPPPAAAPGARRPSHWDLPESLFGVPSAAPVAPSPPSSWLRPPSPPSASQESQSRGDELHKGDLDVSLKNAGLQGILDKDFVHMFGLKHDLNRKLAEMESKRDASLRSVGSGASYLTLTLSSPAPLAPPDERVQQYQRVAELFPLGGGGSAAATPAHSRRSTPRSRKSRSTTTTDK